MFRRKVDKKTRKLLTSGATEVFDGKPGEHSPFAMYFLDALETYGGKDGFLTFEDIYKSVERTKPGPIEGNFGRWEPGSNFFFVASENKPSLVPSR
ncbi:MAG: hypothetical protein ACRD6N_20120 [Pyrinomonadaceae bacterium]